MHRDSIVARVNGRWPAKSDVRQPKRTMVDLLEEIIYVGVSVDIAFGSVRPVFGDLFLICGERHPIFAPSGAFAFDSLEELQFDQVDDYFAVRSLDEGADVIWLVPLIDGDAVDHHPGPFDGVRLSYNVLRNPAHRADHYLKCVASFARFGVSTTYRDVELGSPPDLSRVRADIDAVVRYWASQGITAGSTEALMIDF